MGDKSGREMAQGVRKVIFEIDIPKGVGRISMGVVGSVQSLVRTPFTAHL